jgi:hypothetical protein
MAQLPPTQLIPAAQAWPQLPQFAAMVSAASQPLAALPSQSP